MAHKVLHKEAHARYVVSFQKDKKGYEYVASEYLRLSGIYWGTTALMLLTTKEEEYKEKDKNNNNTTTQFVDYTKGLSADEVVADVLECRNADGGFASAPGHDSHLLYTLSAVQVLCNYDRLHKELSEEQRRETAKWVASLQSEEDGSFKGDKWGEVDTRFSYCASSCLRLLGFGPELGDIIDVEKAVSFVLSCRNFDEGFGARPGDETHAGQVFCCVGALALLDALDRVDADRLAWWLCERQTEGGGLNGRPQKKQDVCYTWWVLSSLSMLGRLHWVDRTALVAFILSCQDPEEGGISDRPDDEVDVFHTFFGIAGLSLLKYPGLSEVNAKYAMPQRVIEKMGLA